MTIDKIKHYMSPVLFDYWISVSKMTDAVFWIKRGKMELEKEINSGRLSDIKYQAELNLLNHLLS